MNKNIFLILLACVFLSACASTPQLDRELMAAEKIETVRLTPMSDSLNIQASDNTTTSVVAGGLIGLAIGSAIDGNINSKRKKALEPFIEMLVGLDVNKVFKNAVEHNLTGSKMFTEDLVFDTEADQEAKDPFLTPIVTPKVVMLSNYSGVKVELGASMAQGRDGERKNRYVSSYVSEQVLDSESLGEREDNKQFWKDNSVLLREKIVDGLYDVAKQFADDYNTN